MPESQKESAMRFRVVEHDNMTGADRDLANMAAERWLPTFTRAEAEATVEWRKANITNRYSYEIVEAPGAP